MTGQGGGQRTDILGVLSENLPDELLRAYFPALEPTAVRGYLAELASKLDRAGLAVKPPAPAAGGGKNAGPELGADRLILFTDGASRGNPGEAGAGIVLRNEQGEEIEAKGFYLGQCTNNVAEYKALLLGLREAKKYGARAITIYLDSELIVRQLTGVYRVKDEKLKPLFAEVMTLLRGFTDAPVAHVPRSKNRRADELANLGIDRKLSC